MRLPELRKHKILHCEINIITGWELRLGATVGSIRNSYLFSSLTYLMFIEESIVFF